MCCKDYTKLAIESIESRVKLIGIKLSEKVTTPMSYEDAPELDISREYSPQELTFYPEIIGMLSWGIDIGRVDVIILRIPGFA